MRRGQRKQKQEEAKRRSQKRKKKKEELEEYEDEEGRETGQETSPLSSGNLCISHLISLIKLGVVMHGEPSAQRGSTAPSLDFKELADHALTNLLSLHTIDNGVEHWWHHHIKIGQQDMDVSRNVTSKAMGQ